MRSKSHKKYIQASGYYHKSFRRRIFHLENLFIYKIQNSLVKIVIGLNFWANPTPTNKYEYIMTKSKISIPHKLWFTHTRCVNWKHKKTYFEPLHKKPPTPDFSYRKISPKSRKGCFLCICMWLKHRYASNTFFNWIFRFIKVFHKFHRKSEIS